MKGTIYSGKRNNRRGFWLIPVIISLLCCGYNAEAQQKAAFVVGNNDYKETPLKNAVNDANLMEATLQRLGFTVQKVLNASKADFERQMLAFNRNYANAEVRFFYYAGHGYQMEGENYLVPIDATGANKADVILECLNFSTIFSAFQHSNAKAMHIFVMDACRNNPFKNLDLDGRGDVTRGLILRKADFITGSYAAFAADNGQFASDGSTMTNGLYTKVLAEEILKPGVEINILFQKVRSRVRDLSNGTQTPVEENRLIGEKGFYFIQQSDSPAPAPTSSSVVTAEKYYYYVDQNGNRSTTRFADWEVAESEMRNRKLYGRIYSNAGEVFVVDKSNDPVTTVDKPNEPVIPAEGPAEPNKTVTEAKTNGEVWNLDGMEMVFVQGGTFTMGCTSEQGKDCKKDEKPAHQVTVSDFYIGKYEVTQAQWQVIMGSNPSRFQKGDNYPVEKVSWNDVQEFIRKLNTQTGKNYRLPTEAEWEFAARGGNGSMGYKYSGSNIAGDVAWYVDDSKLETNTVGTKSPNELGIYDMSGNVSEWCSDCYGYYNSNAQTNPQGPSSRIDRVLRGGGWGNKARSVRTTYRIRSAPGNRSFSIGFRLVCSAK